SAVPSSGSRPSASGDETPMSKATPARCRVARRYVANAPLALAEPPVATRPKAYSIGQRTPGLGSRWKRGRGAQALRPSLTRSRQITGEPNDPNSLRLQTSASPRIESYWISNRVTNLVTGQN